MTQDTPPQDPLEFMKNMWSSMGFALPGMATPTLDVNELDKRIQDLKAVEGWLKLNLGSLQMSIQGLEMQRATLAAMQAAMSQSNTPAGPDKSRDAQAFNNTALWPWNLMSTPAASADEKAEPPAADKPEPPPKAGRGKKA
ncbi:MAG: hypothetical protein RIR70_1429 [Pseudomonadota bacterium]|jgi:hypothetical protein